MALFHEWFSEFRYNLKVKLTLDSKLKKLLEEIGEFALGGKYMDRDNYDKWKDQIGDNVKQLIRVIFLWLKFFQDNALQFISDNMNHLPMYYVPGTEFK